MWPNLSISADLVTFTEKIFNGKLHFSFSGGYYQNWGWYQITGNNDSGKRMDILILSLELLKIKS